MNFMDLPPNTLLINNKITMVFLPFFQISFIKKQTDLQYELSKIKSAKTESKMESSSK